MGDRKEVQRESNILFQGFRRKRAIQSYLSCAIMGKAVDGMFAGGSGAYPKNSRPFGRLFFGYASIGGVWILLSQNIYTGLLAEQMCNTPIKSEIDFASKSKTKQAGFRNFSDRLNDNRTLIRNTHM
jgi:hypothetical protein